MRTLTEEEKTHKRRTEDIPVDPKKCFEVLRSSKDGDLLQETEYLLVEWFDKNLPHGSGIDCKWEYEFCKNGTVLLRNSYHAMSEHGYYDGYMDFKVRIFRQKEDRIVDLKGPCEGKKQIVHKKGDLDFKIICNDNRKASFYGLKDYLGETLCYSLESIMTNRYEIIEGEKP